jgi:hypothetical protein
MFNSCAMLKTISVETKYLKDLPLYSNQWAYIDDDANAVSYTKLTDITDVYDKDRIEIFGAGSAPKKLTYNGTSKKSVVCYSTIYVDPNGGTHGGNTEKYTYSDSFSAAKTIANPTKDGDTFVDWKFEFSKVWSTSGNKFVPTLTLTAKWESENKTAVAKIGNTGYETLASAIEAAKDGDIIDVCADIDEEVQTDKKLTVKKNGYGVKLSAADGFDKVTDGSVISIVQADDNTAYTVGENGHEASDSEAVVGEVYLSKVVNNKYDRLEMFSPTISDEEKAEENHQAKFKVGFGEDVFKTVIYNYVGTINGDVQVGLIVTDIPEDEGVTVELQ